MLKSVTELPFNRHVGIQTCVSDDAKAEIEKKGRSIVTIAVVVHDESGTNSLEANFDWYIARAPQE